jgi:hypothetical protein
MWPSNTPVRWCLRTAHPRMLSPWKPSTMPSMEVARSAVKLSADCLPPSAFLNGNDVPSLNRIVSECVVPSRNRSGSSKRNPPKSPASPRFLRPDFPHPAFRMRLIADGHPCCMAVDIIAQLDTIGGRASADCPSGYRRAGERVGQYCGILTAPAWQRLIKRLHRRVDLPRRGASSHRFREPEPEIGAVTPLRVGNSTAVPSSRTSVNAWERPSWKIQGIG